MTGGITVRAAVLGLLREFGMTTIFGNPGSTELPLYRDWPSDFRYVLGLQEACVVGMADGYAQTTRNAAFVNLHSAAGLGHALGNVFTAYRNRTPLVIVAGQQARSLMQAEPFLFAADATLFPRPYVKWSNEPARAEDVPAAITRAYNTAMHPPCGPVFVSVPVDDWDAPCPPVAARRVSTALRADPVALGEVAAALDAASRPVLVVGDGVARDRGGVEAVVRLAERLGTPVWASPMAGRCSFPEAHALFAGFLPPVRQEIVRQLGGHDLVVALGAPVFTLHVEAHGPVLPAGTTLFQVTDDPEAACYAAAGQAVVATLRLAIEDLLTTVRARQGGGGPMRAVPAALPEADPITAAYVMQCVHQTRPINAVVVEEAPSSRAAMQAHLPMAGSEAFHACSSGGLGHGLAAAVGVALARRPAPVVALVGDGSAMYAIQSLWTAARLALPLTVVVLRNGCYEALHRFGEHFHLERTIGTMLPGLDFAALAEGQGVRGVRVGRAADLCEALREAFGAGVPTLLDVAIG